MANGSSVNEAFLQKLNLIIQAKMSDADFGVNELSREMGMSRSNLHRRVSEITGKTVVALIAEARLKKAFELLKEETYTVSEVAWKSGFGSATYFNKCFSDFYGFPPGEAAKREITLNPNNLSQLNKPRFSIVKEWKTILIGGISLTVILNIVLFVILLEPLSEKPEKLPKSIAVLPFFDDSGDTTNVYFINGVMEGIISNLSKIEDVTVLPRTSVEQYRTGRPKDIRQIARELDVSYIVEGSGQKIGDLLKVSVNLIEGRTNKILFSESFNRDWEDVFFLQSELATLIANQIEAKITPEENKQIEQKPTKNIAAYNLLLKAEAIPGSDDSETNMFLHKESEKLIREAIRLDSTYSEAYVRLAWNYISQGKNSDTIFYLANRALHFDNENANAYYLKGWCYLYQKGNENIIEAEKAFLFEKKYSNGVRGKAGLAQIYHKNGEYFKAFESYLQVLKQEKRPLFRNQILTTQSGILFSLNMSEEASIIAQNLIERENDSTAYLNGMFHKAAIKDNLKTSYIYALRLRNWNFALPYLCLFMGNYKLSLEHLEEQNKSMIANGNPVKPDFNTATIYLKNGMWKKADLQLKEALNNQLASIKLKGNNVNQADYLLLLGTYCSMDNRKMALEALHNALQTKERGYDITWKTIIKYSPAFDLISNEPEFHKLIQTSEKKLLEEQVKIKALLKKESKVLGLD